MNVSTAFVDGGKQWFFNLDSSEVLELGRMCKYLLVNHFTVSFSHGETESMGHIATMLSCMFLLLADQYWIS